ncbi:MAG: Crp/Fnr family transcriptional regulator [Clostridia bacterium]|nr:Crp/Fnr family transcriptional regulator [Clostridia bacterium]
MTSSEKKKILISCALFEGLSEESLGRAAQTASLRCFAAQEKLFPQDCGRLLGVIASGSARAAKPKERGSVTMDLLGAGDVFGAAAIMGGELPSTEATVIKPVKALVFTSEEFLGLMEKDFELTKNFCRYLTGRIRFLTARVDCMAGSSAAEKLMRYFTTNAEGGTVHLAFGMESLAKAISLSRATLYRALDELEKSGRIARNGHEIRLLQ